MLSLYLREICGRLLRLLLPQGHIRLRGGHISNR